MFLAECSIDACEVVDCLDGLFEEVGYLVVVCAFGFFVCGGDADHAVRDAEEVVLVEGVSVGVCA